MKSNMFECFIGDLYLIAALFLYAGGHDVCGTVSLAFSFVSISGLVIGRKEK